MLEKIGETWYFSLHQYAVGFKHHETPPPPSWLEMTDYSQNGIYLKVFNSRVQGDMWNLEYERIESVAQFNQHSRHWLAAMQVCLSWASVSYETGPKPLLSKVDTVTVVKFAKVGEVIFTKLFFHIFKMQIMMMTWCYKAAYQSNWLCINCYNFLNLILSWRNSAPLQF